ncbi:MAG: DNA polymerase III subunit delta [Microcystaceae cyanobacterium]
MPIYFYWGDNDFTLSKAVQQLREKVLDPNWLQFNYDQIEGDQADSVTQALNQVLTPVFGMGGRLVWLMDTSVCQQASEEILKQLQQTLPAIPEQSYLLFTSRKKPDKRLKTSKLLQKYADFQEFSLISPWKTDELLKQVKELSQELQVKLTPKAMEMLSEAVGNNTRQLWNELEKLKLYGESQTLDHQAVEQLVNVTTQNSLQLAIAIRQGKTDQALKLVSELINRNEPALKIVATLVGQFRTWTIVKLYIEKKEKDDQAIAAAADISNPKRLYFMRKELQGIPANKLLNSFPLLLALESQLKRGADHLETLQTKVIELCQVFKL